MDAENESYSQPCGWNCIERNDIQIKMRTGFHLSVKTGSFCVLIIETSQNGKIYCSMQKFTGFIAGNVIYYNVDLYSIGFD